jgi:hypothetical protein
MQLFTQESPEPCYTAFDPMELEIIERVYNSIWDAIRIADPFRDLRMDNELQATIRRKLFAYASLKGPNDPEALKEAVLESLNGDLA